MKPDTLGRSLALYRQQAGLSQETLADQAGLSVSTLSKLEQGTIVRPSIWTIYSLASALAISIDDLLDYHPKNAQAGLETPHSPIKLVVFDIHGVLIRNWQDLFGDIAHHYQIDPLRAEELFWKYDSLVGCNFMSVAKFNATYAELLNITDFDFFRHYLSVNEANQPMQQLVTKVRAAGVHTAVMSDIYPGAYELLHQQGKLPNRSAFDIVALSCELQVMKPDVAFKTYIEEHSGLSGSDILLIDNTDQNIQEAQEWGWQTVFYPLEHPEQADAHIASLLRLP